RDADAFVNVVPIVARWARFESAWAAVHMLRSDAWSPSTLISNTWCAAGRGRAVAPREMAADAATELRTAASTTTSRCERMLHTSGISGVVRHTPARARRDRDGALAVTLRTIDDWTNDR